MREYDDLPRKQKRVGISAYVHEYRLEFFFYLVNQKKKKKHRVETHFNLNNITDVHADKFPNMSDGTVLIE